MKLRNLFFSALIALVCPLLIKGADIPVTPTGPVFKFSNALTWGISGAGGFNNNFFFTPLSLNESVCVYIKNNNPSNPHTFTASIVTHSDPANISPSDGTWLVASGSAGMNAGASPGISAGIGANVSGVAQVSINLSNSNTQAGSPDTASLTIIQTSGSCFAGGNFFQSNTSTVGASISALQSVSDGISQAYLVQNTVANPASNANLLNVLQPVNPTRTIYMDRVVITTTGAIPELSINGITVAGTGCTTTPSVDNEKIGANQTTATAIATAGCTGGLTPISGWQINPSMTANSTLVLDLRGVIVVPAGAGFGLSVSNSGLGAITGSVSITFFWYEK